MAGETENNASADGVPIMAIGRGRRCEPLADRWRHTAAMNEAAIEVESLTKQFERVVAVVRIGFAVPKGKTSVLGEDMRRYRYQAPPLSSV